MPLGTMKLPDGTVMINVDGTEYESDKIPHSLLSVENVEWITKANPEAAAHMPDIALIKAAQGKPN